MSMKINSLEVENVKRIKAVKLQPSANGLTTIGGNNGQGKTSVLDSIAWALGGDRFRPSMPAREGSVIPPVIKVVMSNGLVVERKGKNSALTVTDPDGKKAGQTLLNDFVEELALNLPKFLQSSGKEKANTLLQVIGVGPQLEELERQEKEIYQERLYVGRTADQKKKFAAEQPFWPDVPEDLVSPSELIAEQQEILARNGQREQWKRQYDDIMRARLQADEQIRELETKLRELKARAKDLEQQSIAAQKSPAELKMESAEELEASIANVEEINAKVRANLSKAKAEDDAREFARQYDELTARLNETRQAKADLLKGAKLPLPGLLVEDGELTYHGQKWDNMSGADQLKVGTAIVKALNPKCGFVLMDKLEQMDPDTLREFGFWLEDEGLQVIATRVSTGNECSIIIEDGMIAEDRTKSAPEPAEEKEPEKPFVPKNWSAGF